jgi:nucleotide-binding universal stress UspA family protein
MFSTIVVGTDGSAPAEAAVRAAGELARAEGLDRVHVVSGHRPYSGAEVNRLARDLPPEFRDVLRSDLVAAECVDEAAIHLRTMDVEPHQHVRPSNGTDAILDVAAEVSADLIVVGSRGLGLGRRVFQGSVSTKVAHHAPCSVLIVHSPIDVVPSDEE